MYPDLYRGLGLKSEELSKYDTTLVGFDRKTVTLRGMIKLPVQIGNKVVEVDFIPTRNYHYRVMSFGLKNVGSTYQRMVTRMFETQLGKNVEANIDDMVVKSKEVSRNLEDLGEVFSILRKHKLCLNTSKCSFGVGSRKFLGCMITNRGIEVNPDQIRAIHNLHPPQNLKEVQC